MPADSAQEPSAQRLALPVPVTLPAPMRRLCQRAPLGSECMVLRDSVIISRFPVDGPNTLANVRSVVATSVAADGDAHFTVCIDDQELGFHTNEIEGPRDANGEASQSLLAYARSMEAVAFRAIDKALDAVSQLTKAASDRETQAAKHAKLHAKSLKVLARAMREHGIEDPETTRAAIESEERQKQFDLAAQILAPVLGGMTGGGGGGKPASSSPDTAGAMTLAGKLLAILEDDERARVLATPEGRVLQSATNDDAAAVAMRSLWSLVQGGQLTLNAETLAKATALIAGTK